MESFWVKSMNNRLDRKKMRRSMGSFGWMLILYYLLMSLCVSTFAEMDIIAAGFRAVIRENRWEAFRDGMANVDSAALMDNGWGYILACVMGVGLMLLWKGRDFFGSIWETRQHMTPGAFFGLLCVFISGQMAFQITAAWQEWVLNQFGLSALEAMASASAGADTLSMFLYMGLFAPVFEEIIFRGVVLRGLMPYGRRLAVLGSALLFGLFHGNIVQSPYAFAVGLVLGFTASQFSIWWAIVLHMVNNLVLGDMITRLTSMLPLEISALIIWAIILAFTIGAVVVLVKHRKSIWRYHRMELPRWECVSAFFTAPGNVVFFLIMEFNAFSMLFY